MKTVNSLEYSRDLVEQETELAMDDRLVQRDLAQETHMHPTIRLSSLQYLHQRACMGRLRKDDLKLGPFSLNQILDEFS